MKNLSFARSFAVLALLGAFSACSDDDDDDGGGGAAAPMADIFATDSTVEDLIGFQIEIAAVSLRRLDTTMTANLLVAPLTVDFLELEDRLGWLVTGELAADDYDAALVDFTPGSASALAEDGSPVTVNMLEDQWIAVFDSPADEDSYRRMVLDLQLDESLSGDVSSGTIDFDPVGNATSTDGSSETRIDEIKGELVSVDSGADQVVIDARVGDEPEVQIGEVLVNLNDTTLLLDEDGSAFATRGDFYAATVSGITLLEVHGRVSEFGQVDAERIEIEDSLGSGGPVVVEIEGLVSAVDFGTGFELLIREVEKGASIADPILSGLGDPTTIQISHDPGTVFVLHDDADGDEVSSAGTLAVGQRVDVEFIMFATEPFPAFKVEIRDERADIEGVITNTSGLPTSFVMHIDDDELVLISGAVLTDSTDVIVDVSDSSFQLQVDGKPSLATTDLQEGLEIEVRGILSGDPSTPMIGAALVKVKPGQLDDATVTAVDAGADTFTTSGGDLDDPFGADISAGPLTFVVAPGATFEGDADSLAELETLFTNLGIGQALRIEVEGIATGEPNEVEAFEIDVEMISVK